MLDALVRDGLGEQRLQFLAGRRVQRLPVDLAPRNGEAFGRGRSGGHGAVNLVRHQMAVGDRLGHAVAVRGAANLEKSQRIADRRAVLIIHIGRVLHDAGRVRVRITDAGRLALAG
jgi:hypothetical protein